MAYNPNIFLHAKDIIVSEEVNKLVQEAGNIYNQNFDGKIWYGRCIFVSWYCSLNCKFCFRSVQKHKTRHPESERRSMGSMLLEALFCKVFNWKMEFLTGGYGIMPFDKLLEIIKNVNLVYGDKIWLNFGAISQNHLEECRSYVEGIVASLETVTPELHDDVCPKKPIEPYSNMFENLQGFKKSIAIIVGLGDKREDIQHLFEYIEKYNLDRITVYALKPVAGTPYTEGPSVDEYLYWISSLRIRFPKLEIIAGTNLRRSEESGYLVKAGANAITKFPATKQFGTNKAKIITELINKEDKNFISNITDCININWEEEIDNLPIKEEYKIEMKDKLPLYLKSFNNPKDKDPACTKF